MKRLTNIYINNTVYSVQEGDVIYVPYYFPGTDREIIFQTYTDVKVFARTLDRDDNGTRIKICRVEWLDDILEESKQNAIDVEFEENTVDEMPKEELKTVDVDFSSMTKAELISYIKDNELDINTVKKTKAAILEELEAYYA